MAARRNTIGAGTAIVSGAQATTALSLGLMGVVIARVLGPAGAGGFSILLAVLLLTTFVSTLGVDLGISYYVGARRWPPGEALRQSQGAAVVFGIVGAAVALAVIGSGAAGAFEHVPRSALLLVLLALPAAVSLTFASQLALALARYPAYAAAVAMPAVGGLALVGILASPFGLAGAAAGLLGAYALTAVLAFVWWLGQLPHTTPSRPGEAVRRVRSAAAFGARTTLGNALQLLNYRADLFILNAVVAAAVVGRYAVAASVTTLGLVLPRALAAVVLPRIAGIDVASRHEGSCAIARWVRHGGILVAGSAAVLAVALQAIPLVYGGAFRGAIPLGLLLLPGTAAIGLSNVLAAGIVGRGRPTYTLYAALLVTPPTITLYLVLIPAMGARGAALASTASYLATMLVMYVFFRAATGIRSVRMLLPGRAELRDYTEVLRRLGRPWWRARASA